ncbi:hypothetical protein CEXT_15431 [Caerostris extrusa]|uniref:Uncharacterized protein n=1 Tax=Caerostris extrusa TaxID=172846 RepID=A0AAV4VEM5_CAEEX|nr:hypothetical protein CEXT_15431 [Caerostris extrusa]
MRDSTSIHNLGDRFRIEMDSSCPSSCIEKGSSSLEKQHSSVLLKGFNERTLPEEPLFGLRSSSGFSVKGVNVTFDSLDRCRVCFAFEPEGVYYVARARDKMVGPLVLCMDCESSGGNLEKQHSSVLLKGFNERTLPEEPLFGLRSSSRFSVRGASMEGSLEKELLILRFSVGGKCDFGPLGLLLCVFCVWARGCLLGCRRKPGIEANRIFFE